VRSFGEICYLVRVIKLHNQETRKFDPGKEEKQMSEEKDTKGKELSQEELENQEVAELPDRENMSLINANVAAPINAAVALNALSDGSTAYANAVQDAPITQGN